MARDSPGRLPEFENFTVDFRLREFRKVIYGKSIEFIPFDSKRGQRLLRKIKKT